MKGIMKKGLLFVFAVLLVCGLGGCGSFGQGGNTAASDAPHETVFKGFETVLKIPIGEGEDEIRNCLDEDGAVILPDLFAVSDSEFLILDSAAPALILVRKDGSISTVSLKDHCRNPGRVAADENSIAVLGEDNVVVLNTSGEVIRTAPIPYDGDEKELGFDLLRFEKGKVYLQMYANLGYLLNEDGFTEVPSLLQMTLSINCAEIGMLSQTWKVEIKSPPVYPIAIRGDWLLAVTYDASGMLAGVYNSETKESVCAPLEMEGLTAVQLPYDLSMSPSGRIYLLSCFEDYAEISEMVFE